jgi:hypothetical protein
VCFGRYLILTIIPLRFLPKIEPHTFIRSARKQKIRNRFPVLAALHVEWSGSCEFQKYRARLNREHGRVWQSRWQPLYDLPHFLLAVNARMWKSAELSIRPSGVDTCKSEFSTPFYGRTRTSSLTEGEARMPAAIGQDAYRAA